MFRHSLQHHHVSQRGDHPGTRPAAFCTHHQALPRVLIDQVEDAYTAAIVGSCAHEVVAPYMVRVLGPEPHARSIVEPQPTTWLLLLGCSARSFVPLEELV